jgi:hypothetical protein
MEQVKWCNGCQRYQPLCDFRRHRLVCKTCEATAMLSRRQKAFTQDAVAYKLNEMAMAARARDKKKRLPNDVTTDWLIQMFGDLTHCPVLAITLDWRNKGPAKWNSPSLDAIHPQLGHVKGNVQVISQRANLMKNDGTLDERYAFAMWCIGEMERIARFYCNSDPAELGDIGLDFVNSRTSL